MTIKEIALPHVEALAKDILQKLAVPALEAAVLKSESKIDDLVYAALKVQFEAEILKLIEKIDGK